ncbi:MAG: hypothetical protein ACTHJJ_04090 [Intrasporangium sp.]|uniref:hypothetical protein n=1 Tax=Intrasporangium sp. TaxID=1925024 RepID=UPI003F7E5098
MKQSSCSVAVGDQAGALLVSLARPGDAFKASMETSHMPLTVYHAGEGGVGA